MVEHKTLDAEHLHDKEHFPDTYENTWEGAHQTAVSGSYYGHLVRRAREDGRITKLGIDPLLPVKLHFDIGYSDATSIWVVQLVGERINCVDYLEYHHQPLSFATNWLRERN
jgi:hypothetical protein